MTAPALRLDVTEIASVNAWRFILREDADGGAFLADHTVVLDPAHPCYAGMIDLPGHLRRLALPDTRADDERRLIAAVGDWIGAQVLGPAINAKLLHHADPSVVVRVLVPPAAERLLTLPVEIARHEGAALADAGISFVIQSSQARPPPAKPISDRLRMLALFSLPPTGSPLNLRRERQALRKLVRDLAGAAQLGIELHVLQYGVTRAKLKEVLQQAEGWDVIHFSGHGQPGALWLEKPDGSPDEVTATELAKLLRQANRRLKLVVLSACLSAAATIEQTRLWLGLPATPAPDAPAAGETLASPEQLKAAPTVARALTETLDCAVLAMRYAVEDEFATDLASELYRQLFSKKQPLAAAVPLARDAVCDARRGGTPVGALSAAAPALFGGRAADLTLVPPRVPGINPDTSLAYIPKAPAHFVGRVGALTRASAALATDSTYGGVLFHGMAGAGKTSCAVELVYHHHAAERFQRFVWYSAPEQGKDIELAMRGLALVIEKRLGLPMVHVTDRLDTLRDWLPVLVEFLENNAVLLVLDNLESLLTEGGVWRDERWAALIEALLTPGGLSRVVLTSRVRPAGLPGSADVIPIHALPFGESLLLVRQLPNLRRLLDGVAAGVDKASGRALVRRLLRLVQGHPKLIELAEAHAADPAKFAARLDAADAADAGGAAELDAFFTRGETALDATTFTATLREWTNGIAATLPAPTRLFFQFLCAIEEEDREDWIIHANWSDVWQRLGHPPPAPELDELLARLAAAGLVDRRPRGTKPDRYVVVIHPGVAEAGRADAVIQPAVDHELAATWRQLWTRAREGHGKQPEAGPMQVRAGLAAFPYLARLGDWPLATAMLDRVVTLDKSPGTVATVLPLMQRVVAASVGTDREAIDLLVLAKALHFARRLDEAERMLRESIPRAKDRGDFALASRASGDLANLLRGSGRLRDALQVVDEKAKYTIEAGHGPWSRLADECWRLQILEALGKHQEVLDRVLQIVEEMRSLPDPPDDNDYTVNVWNVREVTLGVGARAASKLQKWEQALALMEQAVRSLENRGATDLECARSRFNAYGPLLRLNRLKDAEELLNRCRAVFEEQDSVDSLGKVFSALADLQDECGRYKEAKRFEEQALRYQYLWGEPESAAISHNNLAVYLARLDLGTSLALAHRLAAAMIRFVTQSGLLGADLNSLAIAVAQSGSAAAPPDYTSLVAIVEQVPGVRFRELMARLQPREAALNDAMQQIIAQATVAAAAQPKSDPTP